tara:strand:+ start:47921 stop:49279 length:1359 start_codon:yes stop_codon:yes gene_type:complete
MYTWVCEHLYLPALDATKGSPFGRVIAEAQRNATLNPTELDALQAKKLQEISRHAILHSAHYGKLAEGLGISAIESVEQLREFPCLTKMELVEGVDAVCTNQPKGKIFPATTSGSTGIALRFFFDSHQWAWGEACQWRGRGWWGLERGAKMVVLWSRPVDRSGMSSLRAAAKYRLRNSLQFDTFTEFNADRMDEVVSAIQTFKPEIIYGYGSSIGAVATHMLATSRRLTPSESPRIVEFTADTMYEQEVRASSQAFGAPVLSAYGASEVPGVSQQCWAGNMHISVDNAVVEFLGEDGEPVAPGEVGELVLTTLNNFAMPLLRYRVGDMGSLKEGSCRCGSHLPMMNLTIGKAVDLITTSAKSNVSAHVFDYINIFLMNNDARGIRQFAVEQTAPDRFILKTVHEEGDPQRACELFIEKMQEKLGPGLTVSTEVVDDIPLSPSGKRRYFKKTF